MVDDTQFLHGRVDPGLESSIGLVEAVDVEEPETAAAQHRNWIDSEDERSQSQVSRSQVAPTAGTFKLSLLVSHASIVAA
jgi:hypothetical protein